MFFSNEERMRYLYGPKEADSKINTNDNDKMNARERQRKGSERDEDDSRRLFEQDWDEDSSGSAVSKREVTASRDVKIY